MGNARKINFSYRLSELLEKREKTQQEVADYVGVKRQTIAQWKDGNTTPDIYSFQKIAKYFDVPYEYLLGETDNEKRRNTNYGLQLGLSDDAVNNLTALKKYCEANEKANIVSELIGDQRFLNAVRYLMKATDEYERCEKFDAADIEGFYSDSDREHIANENGMTILSFKEMSNYCVSRAVDVLRYIAYKIPERIYLKSIGLFKEQKK